MKNNKKKTQNSGKKPLIIAGICATASIAAIAFGKAFKSMKASAKAQHEVDKANFAAAKAESRAQWEEAKAMSNPVRREELMQKKRDEQISAAQARKAEAEERIENARS